MGDNKKGYTLIELIFILVIIAILASVFLPAVSGFVRKSRGSIYVAEAKAACNAVRIYILEELEHGEPDYYKISKEITSRLHPLGDPENPLTEYMEGNYSPGAMVVGVGFDLKTGRLLSLTYTVDSYMIDIIVGKEVRIIKVD